MAYFHNSSDINQTFIIEPIYITGNTPSISACTFVYTNALASCSGDTTIFMGSGVISFDGNIYTNDSLTADAISATTISATTFYGDGSNLTGISIQDTMVTGGTYSDGSVVFTDNTGGTFSVSGFSTGYTLTTSAITQTLGYVPLSAYTDTRVTGATLSGTTIIFDRNDLLNAYSVDISPALPNPFDCNDLSGCTIIQDIQSDIVNLEGMITGLTFNVLSGNVIYVDKLNGNNATGTINDFTKPFSTLSAALIFSESVPKTDTNKILIKVRPGEYNDEGQMYFIDNVDIYCEPGVYFTGKFQFDTTGAVKSNFYGYAVFNVTYVPTSANAHFRVSHPSYINIEFDKLYGITPALIALYTGTDNLINFKANYVYTKGFNSGFGMSLRSDCNANIDIKKYDSLYQLFSFVSLSGVVNVNIEEGNLLEGDPYTYNGFKSIFRFTSNGTIPGSVYATGNYFIKITTQPVSISSAVRFWAGGNTKFYFKGIMDCGLTHPGIFLTDGTNEMNFEGKLIGYRELITVGGACKFNMKNSDVKRLGNANVSPINLSSTAISHINNSNFYTERNGTFSSLFNNSRLYMNNVLVEAVSSATTQQFITVSSTANFGVSNSITNMTYNTSLTPLYLINFSVGPNINVTKI